MKVSCTEAFTRVEDLECAPPPTPGSRAQFVGVENIMVQRSTSRDVVRDVGRGDVAGPRGIPLSIVEFRGIKGSLQWHMWKGFVSPTQSRRLILVRLFRNGVYWVVRELNDTGYCGLLEK